MLTCVAHVGQGCAVDVGEGVFQLWVPRQLVKHVSDGRRDR